MALNHRADLRELRMAGRACRVDHVSGILGNATKGMVQFLFVQLQTKALTNF